MKGETPLNSNQASNFGFTLVEVAIAVAILGLALSTLIGYQTRMTDVYVQEKNIFRGTLAAQYLIAFLETEATPPEPGESEGTLVDKLRERDYFEGESLDTSREKYFESWRLIQKVTSVDYAEFTDILRRVELTVAWGESASERVSLVLFINTIQANSDRSTP